MASRCLNAKIEMLETVVRDDTLMPARKMESFILTNLRYTHGQWADRPRVNELADAVCQQRADIVDDYVAQMQSMFKRILKEGIAAGEFAPCDPDETAEALKAATFLFDYPGAMTLCSLEVFGRKANGAARLILNGLKNY